MTSGRNGGLDDPTAVTEGGTYYATVGNGGRGGRIDPNPHLDGATLPSHLAERVVECGTTRTITCDACHWTHVVTCRRPAAHREPGGYLPDGHVSDPLHPACEHHAFTIWKDA